MQVQLFYNQTNMYLVIVKILLKIDFLANFNMNLILFKKNTFWTSLVLIILNFNSCVSFENSELDNLNDDKVLKIGHAGSGFSSWIPFNPYPANSFTSLQKAIVENKADGVEVDVHMTADGKFILYHDNKLESKTNLSGCISELKYNDIVKANYQLGAPFDWFQSEKIIGLDSLILFLKQQKQFPYLHLDIRHYSVCLNQEENYQRSTKMIKSLIGYLKSFGIPTNKVVLISLSHEVITKAKELKCPYELSLEETANFEEGLEWVKKMQLPYLTIKPGILSAEQSSSAHKAGIKIITFGAKSKSGNKRLLEVNPDVIQSNNLEALNSLLLE